MATTKTVSNKNAKQLIGNFKTVDGKLQQIQTGLQQLDGLLGKVLDIIHVPRDVSEGLTGLDDTMGRVHSLLAAVKIVPPISEAAEKLESKVSRLQEQTVQPLREKANKTEEDIDPYRKYSTDLRKFYSDTDPLVEQLDKFIQQEHSGVTKKDSSNTSLQDSRYKRNQQQQLEDFSAGINKDLVEPMRVQDKMLKAEDAVGKDLENIENACRLLTNLLKPPTKVHEGLSALEEQLMELDKALDKELTLVYYRISIRKLFGAEKAVPFADKFSEMALEELKRLLDQLDLEAGLSMPDIDKIEGEMQRVLDHYHSIDDTMKVTRPQMEAMFQQKSLENTINHHDV